MQATLPDAVRFSAESDPKQKLQRRWMAHPLPMLSWSYGFNGDVRPARGKLYEYWGALKKTRESGIVCV
jgi:hypothetical protein